VAVDAMNGFHGLCSKLMFRIPAAVVAVVFATGCSTVRPFQTHRKGFFAALERGESRERREKRDRSETRRERLEKRGREPASVVKVDKSGLQFRWPLAEVTVTSGFGKRSEGFHEGIDLRAPAGTPVYAAEAGRVLYADRRISGYGKMVVIQHAGKVATVYAHNSKVLVRRGQKVSRGQKIAFSGETGHARGPHLHFEVRHSAAPVDPEKILKN
jgi:murein DD-endopeptidase MepM/ murein hydrolase activator NlpD